MLKEKISSHRSRTFPHPVWFGMWIQGDAEYVQILLSSLILLGITSQLRYRLPRRYWFTLISWEKFVSLLVWLIEWEFDLLEMVLFWVRASPNIYYYAIHIFFLSNSSLWCKTRSMKNRRPEVSYFRFECQHPGGSTDVEWPRWMRWCWWWTCIRIPDIASLPEAAAEQYVYLCILSKLIYIPSHIAHAW